MLRTILAPLFLLVLSTSCDKNSAREIYSLTLYRMDTLTQEQMIDEFLSKALLPALHRAGVGT